MNCVQNYKIPESLVINQTPSKYAAFSNSTMAAAGQVLNAFQLLAPPLNKLLQQPLDHIRQRISTYAIDILGGKTSQSLPRFKFPNLFSFSMNPKHFSNTDESVKLLNEIAIPSGAAITKDLGLEST